MNKIIRGIVISGVGIAAVVATAVPAAAFGHQDGVEDPDELIFYYNSNYKGSKSDFIYWSVANLASPVLYKFLTSGNGQGTNVKNNAASARNRDDLFRVRIYFNSNYKGPYDTVNQSSARNLSNTYNDNASFRYQQ